MWHKERSGYEKYGQGAVRPAAQGVMVCTNHTCKIVRKGFDFPSSVQRFLAPSKTSHIVVHIRQTDFLLIRFETFAEAMGIILKGQYVTCQP